MYINPTLSRWEAHTVSSPSSTFSLPQLTLSMLRRKRASWSVPPAWGDHLCSSSNETPSTFVFLISTRAGGLGLNLTSANRWTNAVSPSYKSMAAF